MATDDEKQIANFTPGHDPKVDAAVAKAEAVYRSEQAERAALIDEAWLRSIGLEDTEGFRDHKRFCLPDEFRVACARATNGPKCWIYSLCCGNRKIKDDPTRGELLDLLSILGVVLKRGSE